MCGCACVCGSRSASPVGQSQEVQRERPGKVIQRIDVEHFQVLSFAIYRSVDR